jgi:hypothetical protein
MVLEQSAIDTHTQLCFDFNTDVHQVNVYFSPSAGFTGGDTSNRPTAVDELVVQAPFQPISLFTSFGQGLSMRAHVMMSTDGHSTRIVTCGGNVARGFICVDVPIDPPAGWTNPVIAAATWSENAPPADALGFVFWKQGTFTFKSQGPITTMPLYMVLQGYATNGTANGTLLGYSPWPNADELSGEFPLGGVGIAHTTTVGQRGRHGYLADWYFTALSVLQGNSFPGDGSKSWVVFGNSVFPWDGGNVEMG